MSRNQPRPRKNSSTPSYRRQSRPSGKDDAFVEIDGQRIYLGLYEAPESREKYHRLIAQWESTGRAVTVAPHEITVAELASRYMAWVKAYYRKHDHETAEPSNIALAIRPLLKLYGSSSAADFGPKAFKTVRKEMIKKGWTRNHINKSADRVRRLFKWAVAEELVPPGVYEGLRAVVGLRFGRDGTHDNPPIKPAPEELVHPVKAFVSRQLAAMIDLQLLTGARPGEVTIMRPCDIDRSGSAWVYRPREHKTEHHGHERVIFIGPKAQEVLAPFLLRPADAYCFSPAEAEKERRAERTAARVTPENRGNCAGKRRRAPSRPLGDHYTNDSYRRAIERGIEEAFPPAEHLRRRHSMAGAQETIPEWKARLTKEEKAELKAWYRKHHWHPHQLRHNYATSIRKQFGLEAAQVLLGHSKADVTQVYAECNAERAEAIVLKVG